MREGRYSCIQWVLGKLPPRVDGLQMDTDHFGDLGIAFFKEDCSSRVAKALIHKSAPIPTDYAVADLIQKGRIE
eukprot:1322914-Karenia_brevis.AAC.1